MARYRYRTCAIIGPWRRTAHEAIADAVKARQARWEGAEGTLHWLVPGEIEEDRRVAA